MSAEEVSPHDVLPVTGCVPSLDRPPLSSQVAQLKQEQPQLCVRNVGARSEIVRDGMPFCGASGVLHRDDAEGTIVADYSDATRQGVLWVFSALGARFTPKGAPVDAHPWRRIS